MDDWRLRWQEDYLKGRTFMLKQVTVKEHSHCEFCWEKFYQNEEKYAYITLDSSYIVCRGCFEDFKEQFKFRTFSKDIFANKKMSEIIRQEIDEIVENSMIFDIEKVENLAEVLKETLVWQENIMLIPVKGTFKIKHKTTIEFIDRKICVKSMKELLEAISDIKKDDYNLFIDNKTGTHQRLCVQLREI